MGNVAADYLADSNIPHMKKINTATEMLLCFQDLIGLDRNVLKCYLWALPCPHFRDYDVGESKYLLQPQYTETWLLTWKTQVAPEKQYLGFERNLCTDWMVISAGIRRSCRKLWQYLSTWSNRNTEILTREQLLESVLLFKQGTDLHREGSLGKTADQTCSG